jgi:O-antigen/teichoic acid export membrane protein
MIRVLLQRAWESPTFATWGSIGSRALVVAMAVPIVVTRFTEAEITLWYLFTTILVLQMLADIGFGSVFTRAIAYGAGGSDTVGDFRDVERKSAPAAPNWDTILRVTGTSRFVYFVIATTWFLALVLGGTWVVADVVTQTTSPAAGWIAWGIVIVSSTIRIYGLQFVAFLMGTNHVALFRRWESLFWLIILAAVTVVFASGGKIIQLALAMYGLQLFNVMTNVYLCRRIRRKSGVQASRAGFDRAIFRELWPRAWRSGLGLLAHSGAIQVAAIYYAKVSSPAAAASYLLAANLGRSLDQFSQAPFYSRIPRLSQLRVGGDLEAQREIAGRGMLQTSWILVFGLVALGVSAQPILEAIGSNADFVSQPIWALMSIGFFLERYGAMNLQLYSATNHIVWHVASGVSGLIYVVTLMLLFDDLGVYALPIAHIAAGLLWYGWYGARKAYSAYGLTVRSHELRTNAPPFLVLLAFAAAVLWPA